GLRAMAQRDPLVEYQREGYAMFQTMMGQIREETIGFLFNLEVSVQSGGDAQHPQVQAAGLGQTTTPEAQLQFSAPSEQADGEVEVRRGSGQVDRAATARAQLAQARQAKVQQAQATQSKGAFGQA